MAKTKLRVISDKDNGFTKFFADLKDMGKQKAYVGVLGEKGAEDHDGVTNVDLATIHEFGAPKANIPERSFLRSTADKNADKYRAILKDTVKRLVKKPKTFKAKAALMQIAEQGRTDVIDAIKSAEIKPQLPTGTRNEKIRERYPAEALIREGQLIGAIQAEVR